MPSITSSIYELSGPGELHLRQEIIDPDTSGVHDVIAETVYSAISPGTEVSAYMGTSPLRPGKIYPRMLGYCNVAKVIHTGSGVSRYKKGDHILTFQPHCSAFKCAENDFIILLDEETNLRHAVTAYLYHLGYHGLISADAKAGHYIGVIGIGTLGFTACMMGKLAGATVYAMTNQAEAQQKLSHKQIMCFGKDRETPEKINAITDQAGLDIVINTSNKWADWLLALQLVNKGGTIVNVGFPGRGEPLPDYNPLDPQYVYMKNVTIKALCPLSESDENPHHSRFNRRTNLLFILDLMKKQMLNPGDIISSEIHYPYLKDQYEQYLKKDSSLFTTIIKWK